MEDRIRYFVKHLEDWLSVSEAAELLGIKRQTLHQHLACGKWSDDDLRVSGDRILLRESEVVARASKKGELCKGK